MGAHLGKKHYRQLAAIVNELWLDEWIDDEAASLLSARIADWCEVHVGGNDASFDAWEFRDLCFREDVQNLLRDWGADVDALKRKVYCRKCSAKVAADCACGGEW